MSEIISPFDLYEKLEIKPWDDGSPNRLMPNSALSEKGLGSMKKELSARENLLVIIDDPAPIAICDDKFDRDALVSSIENLRHRIWMMTKPEIKAA